MAGREVGSLGRGSEDAAVCEGQGGLVVVYAGAEGGEEGDGAGGGGQEEEQTWGFAGSETGEGVFAEGFAYMELCRFYLSPSPSQFGWDMDC